jgi:hypothetical protein
MGEDLARLLLLLIAAAAFVNITRGTFRSWLNAKFVGSPAPASTAAAAPFTPSPAAAAAVPSIVDTRTFSIRPLQPPRPRDMSALKAGDRFSSPSIVRAAFKYAPKGQIPHAVEHEGTRTVHGGKTWVTIKYVDPRGGTNTIEVPVG